MPTHICVTADFKFIIYNVELMRNEHMCVLVYIKLVPCFCIDDDCAHRISDIIVRLQQRQVKKWIS